MIEQEIWVFFVQSCGRFRINYCLRPFPGISSVLLAPRNPIYV